jgi:SAM-dependent methyltransferase
MAGLGHDDGPSLLRGPRRWTIVGVVADHYADGTYRWWHLSQPSPELVSALGDGWLPGGSRVLDVGCGLGSEAGHLAAAGRQAVGIDLSSVAIARAAAGRAATGRTDSGYGNVAFLRADVRALPFGAHHFDAAVDRGCFHYLPAGDRGRYADELRRVLRPGGKFLLRASLRAAGERNDIDEAVIARCFASWSIDGMARAAVPSDTRLLDVLVVRLSAPARP